MRNRKLVSAVLSVTVILGIVGCEHNSDTRVKKNDIEITSQAAESLGETIQTGMSPEDAATAEVPEGTYMSEYDAIEFTSQTSQEYSESTEPSETTKESEPQETTETQTPTDASKATATPTSEQKTTPTATAQPTAAPEPTSSPTPMNTPVPTNTPSPVPTPFDIDKSAKENGYEIIDIDMGEGKTERIYGYYVDMSGLSSKINDYRESIGLARLPTDTGCVSEMKTRAAEATVKFSHWRPNGQGGQEANLAGSVSPGEAYEGLYNSDPHRMSWEDTYSSSIYSVGFRRMIYREDKGEWSGGGGATVVYFGDNLS